MMTDRFYQGPGEGMTGKLTDVQQEARTAWQPVNDTTPGNHQLSVISVTPFPGSQMHHVYAVDPASLGWQAPEGDRGRLTGTFRP